MLKFDVAKICIHFNVPVMVILIFYGFFKYIYIYSKTSKRIKCNFLNGFL